MQSHKRGTNEAAAAAIWLARRLFAACCCLALLTLPQLAHSFSFGAITTVVSVDMKGNAVTVDSFDSTDTNHSDWNTNLGYGTYDSAKRKDNGNIATDGLLINVGNANIYGRVDTGSGGTTSISSSGSVGSLAWVDGNNSGIQPGYSSDDMNVNFPDVTLPLGPWTLFSGSTISTSGYYQINSLHSSLNIQGSGTPPAHINVTLYLPSGIIYSGSTALIVGTNASVTIYSGGNISTSGNAAINNLTQNALNLAIYGLPGCTSISFGGNAAFTGIIYAPSTDFNFSGGGNNTYDFVGAVISKTATLSASAHFHYDENLTRSTAKPIWFTAQPTSCIAQPGTNVTFSVSIGGGSPMSYQWFFNQTNPLSFGTHSSLTLTNVQLTDLGIYSVIVTNSANALTSAPAILFVYTNSTQLAAQLAAQANPTNGQFQFNIVGVTGFNYAVQVSSNLVNWVSLQTNVVPFGFADTNANLAPQRFYRSVFMP